MEAHGSRNPTPARTQINKTQPPRRRAARNPRPMKLPGSLRRYRGAGSEPTRRPPPPPKIDIISLATGSYVRMEAGTGARPVQMLSKSRDWSELPADVLPLVFANLGAVDILMGSGLVCHSWLEAAKVPHLWRSVDMANHKVLEKMDDDVLCEMAKVAMDRSKGQLEVFLGKFFVTDEILKYIGDRGFTDLIMKSPLLEDLSLGLCPRVGGRKVFEATVKACPHLKRFSLHRELFRFSFKYPERYAEASGFAAMRELRSLSLTGSSVSTRELQAILDGCPHLETLFLRDCYDVVSDSALQAKCARIKTVTIEKYKWVLERKRKRGRLQMVLRQYE
ncbi:putative F-box/LRR-repeat protein 23 [Panicum miliaceum]|uniref:F-box/LRR-repeat protein 23 n=1 Tax=Panicum miliaceum TaxID=4540 RepID=A0A3L6PPP8_PANMI|nr:putative F-box/LRR-repeat protein 23 [Panicum miliaceum]